MQVVERRAPRRSPRRESWARGLSRRLFRSKSQQYPPHPVCWLQKGLGQGNGSTHMCDLECGCGRWLQLPWQLCGRRIRDVSLLWAAAEAQLAETMDRGIVKEFWSPSSLWRDALKMYGGRMRGLVCK